MKKQYTLGRFLDRTYIQEKTHARIYGYGPGFDWAYHECQHYRAEYSRQDAEALVGWLNERAAGYPKSKLMPP
jgi:hypothetical protein